MSKTLPKGRTFKELVDEARTVEISSGEVRTIQAVIKHHPFPDDVRSTEISFGSDWSGDPAAWIVCLIEDDLHPSNEKISRLNAFAALIRDALPDTHPTYWPYVDIRAIC